MTEQPPPAAPAHAYFDAEHPDTARHPPVPCPECGAKIDAASGVADGEGMLPSAGDISVCLYCAAVLIFELVPGDTAFSLRRATLKEMSDAPAIVMRTVKMILLIQKKPPP